MGKVFWGRVVGSLQYRIIKGRLCLTSSLAPEPETLNFWMVGLDYEGSGLRRQETGLDGWNRVEEHYCSIIPGL